MFKEFREFAARGNVIDMAVGVIMGAAFGAIVKGLVDDIVMPPIGLALGGVDFSNLFLTLKDGNPPGPYASLAAAQGAGAVLIAAGSFINKVISFLIVAMAVFFLVRGINMLRRQAEATTKDCPYCASAIPIKASRCPHCTSELARAA